MSKQNNLSFSSEAVPLSFNNKQAKRMPKIPIMKTNAKNPIMKTKIEKSQ